ncbi:ABC transporter ATP-binding protein [Atribacter laminatus]|jgi:osmoprotectant transport system ATP-binding protein|uniref:Glycine betaine/carnitine/choline transport ATP-binding protein OpuCA n=1 Tax=Atribacter laminatus TaxID=2847778 RepID=A0A7T1F393_ATRLM|nr:betaine/proline/choline family ABC transporter ATP-binding protein [Atribacter laminatus]QPM68445.1 Glycine betaine/carnitine/choline transport ATP-binding protein OpuCA [Atribacter laminatus]
MIQLKNITKQYPNNKTAVAGINLEIPAGKIFSLIGPSGCGKTSILKMINRLIEPTAGEIFLQGQNIAILNPIELRRNIGYVIQQIGLFPHLTIEENIGFVLKICGAHKETWAHRAEELIFLVGLDESYLKRYPRELSGGQQQRIGVARALAANPPLILMDEPFGAIDEITREQLQNELLQLQKRVKKTIVFVTHDLREAVKLSDQIAIMQSGNIVQVGTPNQLLFFPANPFVEEFMGSNGFFNSLRLLSIEEALIKEVPFLTKESTSQEIKTAIQNAQDLGWNLIPVLEGEKNILGYTSVTSVDLHQLQPAGEVLLISMSFEQALKKMFLSGKQFLPVVDSQNHFVGFFDFTHTCTKMKNACQSWQ